MRYVLFLLLLLKGFDSACQHYSKCLTYQFFGKDSSKIELVRTQLFNEKGKLSYEEFRNYKETYNSGSTDCNVQYYYNDTLLQQTVSVDASTAFADTTIVDYFYDERKLLKRIVNRHYGGVVPPLPYEGADEVIVEKPRPRKWLMPDTIDYENGGFGLKIKEFNCNENSSSYFTYDGQQRRTVDSFISGRDAGNYVIKYVYSSEGYTKSKHQELSENTFVFSYALNKVSDISKESIFVIEPKGKRLLERTEFEYDRYRRLVKTVNSHENKNVKSTTHILKYE